VANTILIVDDSPTAMPELKALLESQDFAVLTALRAEEALDTLKIAKVDLIITEALLPGMDGFELVRQVRRNPDWSHMPFIMLTVRSAPEDYALSYEVGADEYFLKPMEPPKILATTRGLITKYEAARANMAAGGAPLRGTATAASLMPARSETGSIITIFSLKGGVGTSTLAVNLALAIKQLTPSSRVGLIDLALEQNADALLLDVKPTSTIAEWAHEDLREASPFLLNQYFVQHKAGISLMAAPASPEQSETVRPDAVRKALELAPQTFDYVVVDTASTFNENSIVALEQAEYIIIPMIPDMGAIYTTSSVLRIVKALSIPSGKIRVVFNQIVPNAGLTKGQVESSLGRDVFEIPHGGDAFYEAVNQGLPLVTTLPGHPATRAIIELAKTVCDPEVTLEIPDARPAPAFLKAFERLRRV
jgi:pilus assembly protein CpaE